MKERIQVFVFRRDLRMQDNLALARMLAMDPSLPLVPLFIFHPDQIHPSKNPYYGQHSVEFLIESLEDLNSHLEGKLVCMEGTDQDVLQRILNQYVVVRLGFNKDYTPYALRRDAELEAWCEQKGVESVTAFDYTLFPPGMIAAGSGKHYEVYTPFYKKCMSMADQIPRPKSTPRPTYFSKKLPGHVKDITVYYGGKTSPQRTLQGGRRHAMDILARIRAKHFLHYEKVRDYPALDQTTKLSAYMKYGCVSVREVFWEAVQAYGLKHGLPRELFWREFCAYITHHVPHILQGQIRGQNLPLRKKYTELVWAWNDTWFTRWKEGTTGFPLVDAAMRCMNATGFMHNRLRMVVSMFLTKDMRMDWRHGERYFAQQLVDYDPASNACGWQWSASVGADAQPYFRIFNPWTQGKRFDADATFIKTWVPELRDIPAKVIHAWDTHHKKYTSSTYPAPMLDHHVETKKVKEMFTAVPSYVQTSPKKSPST